MSDPLAYFLTWTTYGTWLPGDERGWVPFGGGIEPPVEARNKEAKRRLRGTPVVLDDEQRRLVESVIRKHCDICAWTLHAVNVRSNHVHVVVCADVAPETAMGQFKAWCSRRLNEAATPVPADPGKRRWWTEHGSTRWINDERSLIAAVAYVVEGQ